MFFLKKSVRLFGNMWLDGMVSIGNHLNHDGAFFIVYDTYDPIKLILNVSFSYYFKNNTFCHLLVDTARRLGVGQ